MWHKFPQPMRNVLLRALRVAAARQPRHALDAAAQPQDFFDALALEPDGAEPVTEPVTAISPESLKIFEDAYEHAALLDDRLIGTDHLLLALTDNANRQRVLDDIKRSRAAGIGPDSAAPAPSSESIALSATHAQLATDPYPIYRTWREKLPPLRRDPLLPAWIVSGYDEVQQVLKDSRFSSQPRSNRTRSGTLEIDALPAGPVRRDLCVIGNVLSNMMLFSDAPQHSRMRATMGQVFSPRNVANLRPIVQRVAEELVDVIAQSGRREFDLIADFASPLPLLVIADVMGMSRRDAVQLKEWSVAFASLLGFSTSVRQDLSARRAIREMRGYFERIVAEMRGRPNPASLLSQMITPPDGSPPLEEEELFGNWVLLLAAGHETTTSILGTAVRALLQHPEQMQTLTNDLDGRIAHAVEELLRFESPLQWTSRRAKEDVIIADEKIPKNATVLLSMGAANRDPRQFPDPDRLDLSRANAASHLAFSAGSHFCLGAALARIELQVGLGALLRRLPAIRTEESFRINWRPGTTWRSIEALPMRF
ncbi:MAG: hypothetical protein QOF78_2712 [Phycisphaerales bacterium]|jgi:cytochrome P450|nr:hypothetical protein [Phycisphaerales bacterium]